MVFFGSRSIRRQMEFIKIENEERQRQDLIDKERKDKAKQTTIRINNFLKQ